MEKPLPCPYCRKRPEVVAGPHAMIYCASECGLSTYAPSVPVAVTGWNAMVRSIRRAAPATGEE